MSETDTHLDSNQQSRDDFDVRQEIQYSLQTSKGLTLANFGAIALSIVCLVTFVLFNLGVFQSQSGRSTAGDLGLDHNNVSVPLETGPTSDGQGTLMAESTEPALPLNGQGSALDEDIDPHSDKVAQIDVPVTTSVTDVFSDAQAASHQTSTVVVETTKPDIAQTTPTVLVGQISDHSNSVGAIVTTTLTPTLAVVSAGPAVLITATPDSAAPTPPPGVDAILVSNVEARRGPGDAYSVLEQLTAGEPILVNGRNSRGTWVRIQFRSSSGWVPSTAIRMSVAIETIKVVPYSRRPI